MKIEFLTDFEARTTTGVQLISAGRVVDLEENKANRLISAGVAKVVVFSPSFNPEALPYIDNRGRLIIPFDSPPKYRYWSGGQSVRDTLKEIIEKRAASMELDDKSTKELTEDEATRIMSKHV